MGPCKDTAKKREGDFLSNSILIYLSQKTQMFFTKQIFLFYFVL